MAIISLLIGGSFGFVSFLTAWLGLDYGMMAALGVYIGIGSLTSLGLVLIAYARSEIVTNNSQTDDFFPAPANSVMPFPPLFKDFDAVADARKRSRMRAAHCDCMESVH